MRNFSMVLAVSDSDILIHLTKLNQLNLLKEQFSRIYISEIVYNESVIQGISREKKDAYTIQEFIETGQIITEKINEKDIKSIINKHNIHKGESSILALASKYEVDYCMTNEIRVRNVMKSEGFKVVGTLGIILMAFNTRLIDKKSCLKVLQNIEANSNEFRFHPRLIQKVI